MQALLKYAVASEVAKALTENGYPVHGATVSRWAHGRGVTPRTVRLVEELWEELLGEAGAARPKWAKRLDMKMDAMLKAVGIDPLEALLDEVVGTDEPPVSDEAHPETEPQPAPADEPQ